MSSTSNTYSSTSYEVYHQADKVDTNENPSFIFTPINDNGLYTNSEIQVSSEYAIYHQPDEVQ